MGLDPVAEADLLGLWLHQPGLTAQVSYGLTPSRCREGSFRPPATCDSLCANVSQEA